MRIKTVQFKNVVSFGGQLQSAGGLVGDRPGATAMEVELDDEQRFFKLTKFVNGKEATRFVPMENVASFEPAPVEAKPAAVKK